MTENTINNTLHIAFDRVISAPVSTKTNDGKSYREIEGELLNPLPPEWHEIKEIGYSKDLGVKTYYAFLPWWRLRERLRAVVGSSGFRFEIVSTYIDDQGDPVTIGVLNVLGVEHQGVGYGRSHGSYKGGKSEIAYADAWKNAAEAHGLGAYLDDQVGVVRYLVNSKSQEAIAKGRQLAIQFQKQNKISLDEIRAWNREIGEYKPVEASPKTPSKPVEAAKPKTTTTPQPTKTATPTTSTGLYPKHDREVKILRERLRIEPGIVLAATGNRPPSQLSLEDYKVLLQEIAIFWADREKKFKDSAIARTALSGAILEAERNLIPLEKAIHDWLDSLEKELTPV